MYENHICGYWWSEEGEVIALDFYPKDKYWDFPGGPVVKNPSCNTGDAGSIPGQGTKIPHAMGQLSSWVATTEPVHHN